MTKLKKFAKKHSNKIAVVGSTAMAVVGVAFYAKAVQKHKDCEGGGIQLPNSVKDHLEKGGVLHYWLEGQELICRLLPLDD